MSDKNKVKLVNEILSESSLSTDITTDIMSKKRVSKREKECQELLDLIYRIIHPSKSCPHFDWEKENHKLYKFLCSK